jgi:hypothetical protein
MAATYSLLQTPFGYNPINAPTWMVAYSTDNQVQGFNYMFNINILDRINGGSVSTLGYQPIPPRPDGTGVFDVHKVIKSQLNVDYGFTMSAITAATSSLIPATDNGSVAVFNINYGWQEYYGLTFSATYATASGFVGISLGSGIVASTIFSLNDLPVIQMSNASSNGIYNGQFVVTGISGNNIITDIPFGVTESISLPGQILTNQRVLGTAGGYVAVNGTRQYYDDNSSNLNNFGGYYDFYNNNNLYVTRLALSNQTFGFLTNWNLPDTNQYKTIYPLQYETVNVLSPTMSYNVIVKTYDNNLNILNTYTLPTQSLLPKSYYMYSLGIGTANLQGLAGINLPSTGYYTVTLGITQSGSNFANFAIARRQIISNCSAFQNVRIMFLNQLGGWDYWNFNYESKITTNINRTTFNKTLNYNYNIGDRGRSVFVTDATDQVMINTDIITDYEYNYLKELLSSPSVYVIDENLLLKLPIVIVDDNWTQKSRNYRDGATVQLSLTYEYAYPINLQSY